MSEDPIVKGGPCAPAHSGALSGTWSLPRDDDDYDPSPSPSYDEEDEREC